MTQSKAPRPLLTIAITCYNAESSIRRALDSALAQTWTPREIVVVDDGSTDRSGVVLEEVERTHDEVHVIRHSSNRGVAEARNTLLARARVRSSRSSMTMTRARRTDWRRSTAECRTTNRIMPERQCFATRIVLSFGQGSSHPTCRARWHRSARSSHHGARWLPTTCWVYSSDDGRHSWGMLGSGTLMARTEVLRALGGFDGDFVAALNATLRSELRCGGTFRQRQYATRDAILTPSADKGDNAELRYRLLLVRKHKRYLKKKRSYAGAWCYMHTHFYRGRDWRWRLWYLAALVCFPRDVSWARMRRSSLLARLRLFPARTATP